MFSIGSERQRALCSQLSWVRSKAQFADALSQITTAYGFLYYSLAKAPSLHDLWLAPLLMETTLPALFIEEFDRRNLLRTRQSYSVQPERRLPVSWRCSHPERGAIISAGMSALMLQFDPPDGIAIPIASSAGERLIFTLSGNGADLGGSEINELHTVTLHMLDAYEAINRVTEARREVLSVRESEVLWWTSHGKTSYEIGRILSLSDHTVNSYLASATRKLACVNRTQLVAKALRQRLIT